jgi:hypothetical protein
MNRIVTILFIGSLLVNTGCAGRFTSIAPVSTGQTIVPAEGDIPGVPPEAASSDFWLRAVQNQDDIILTAAEIDSLNANIRKKGDIRDVLAMPEKIAGKPFRDYLAGNARFLADATFYVTGDIPLEQVERERIIARIDTLAVPDAITLRFGMTLLRSMGRTWPSEVLMMKDAGDNEFDQNVTASVDMATPVALIHASHDGRWVFVQTPRFLCWLPAQAVAFGDRETVKVFVNPPTPVVAIGSDITVYASPETGIALGNLSMGGILPLRTAGSEYCQVAVPIRGPEGELAAGAGYVRRSSDTAIGYLPFSFRNVYRQAFLLYGDRYGWGGMNGDRDCSGFILDVFRSFGIQLPRNSASQAQAVPVSLSFEGLDRATRIETMRSLPGGITLLKLDGHIMIYLGIIDGKPYAIHDFWAWRTLAEDGGVVVHRAARVAVTDLTLGEGSPKGAFIDRLTGAGIIGNYTVSR